MCRWNFRGMLEHPRIRNLAYYCRMDTDSRIRKKVCACSHRHCQAHGSRNNITAVPRLEHEAHALVGAVEFSGSGLASVSSHHPAATIPAATL